MDDAPLLVIADLLLRPPVEAYNTFHFSSIDAISSAGRAHAMAHLRAWLKDGLSRGAVPIRLSRLPAERRTATRSQARQEISGARPSGYMGPQQDALRVAFAQRRARQKMHGQKNWTHVRQLLGYQRLDNAEILPMVNALYAGDVTLLNNLFMPQMKLIEKVRVGAKLIKRYDVPQTPLERLEKSGVVDADMFAKLKALKASLNPIVLRRSIHEQTKAIYQAVSATQKQQLNLQRLGNPDL